MKTLTTYTPNQLESLTLAKITEINNMFATETGLKTTKRFGTKSAAIKKCLTNQAEYKQGLKIQEHNKKATKVDKPKKAPKEDYDFAMLVDGSRETFLFAKTNIVITKEHIEDNSLIGELTTAVKESKGNLQDIIDYMVSEYQRPRSVGNVDAAFVLRKLKKAVAKGFFKFEKVA